MLIFPPNWRKGKSLVSEHTGEPHKCKKDKVNASGKKVWKNDRTVFYHNRKGDYKIGCDAPKNPTPSMYICGKHKTKLGQKSYDFFDINGKDNRQKTYQKTGDSCVLLGSNWCDKFCSECNEHPRIIYCVPEV